MSILISIEKLLSSKYVEDSRMEFRNGWNSVPVRTCRYRNRRIGSFLKELGLTEGKGTGIPIIYRVMKENGSPKPLFDTDDYNRSFFVVEFPICPDYKDGGGSIGSSIDLTDRQKEILNIIIRDNKISYRAIAEKLTINDSAVKKHLTTLKGKGVLKRIGGTRGH